MTKQEKGVRAVSYCPSRLWHSSLQWRPLLSGSRFQEKEDGGFPTGSGANWRSNAVSFPSAVALTQPGLGVTTTTVTTITQTGGDWSTGLFDVDADQTTCFIGAVAPCCLDLILAHLYGECLCLPLLPGSTIAMRVALRERYKIQGSICDDWTTVCCCYSLAMCQMVREMKRRTMTRTYHVSTTLDCS
uniref:PLAC8-like protein 1 isoform X1 n=1 Tax=Doryrhamphus excisus TaxID=161450 RepID=UPI0025AE34BA|nr:PLAC8-like protein 1 isoform X1 [Doryrhamphus excisus]